jgi:hypothetical protein
MTATWLRWACGPALALAALACGGRFEGGGDLRAQKVVLKREVDGLREIAARLERGESMLPADDIVIAIDDALLRDLIGAQLPFEAELERFHLSLKEAEVQFRGSPVVRLRGALQAKAMASLEAAVNVIGALEGIAVDPATSTLKARIVVDHIGIERAAGIESLLSMGTMDELARTIRLAIKDALPPIQIPVRVQQSIDLPAVTRGPVRIDGARMPLQAAVSQVGAGQGRLWIAVHLAPGDLVKTQDAPPSAETTAEDAGVSLAAADEKPAGKPAGKSAGKPAGKPAAKEK